MLGLVSILITWAHSGACTELLLVTRHYRVTYHITIYRATMTLQSNKAHFIGVLGSNYMPVSLSKVSLLLAPLEDSPTLGATLDGTHSGAEADGDTAVTARDFTAVPQQPSSSRASFSSAGQLTRDAVFWPQHYFRRCAASLSHFTAAFY